MKKRVLPAASLLAILLGSTGCQTSESVCGRLPDGGKGDPDFLTNEAQACPDRASLGFAQEFNSGTFIGTSAQENLRIQNGGLADLNVSAVTLSGDPAFTFSTAPGMIPASIKGKQNLLIRVFFAPTEARAYSGKITVQSNADLLPEVQFDVSGCGVPSDGGTSPCYRDGGR